MAFQTPVGTQKERDSGEIWPGTWFDFTPYGKSYEYGIHTGADLNNNAPRWDSDAHAPVHAIGDGKVSYARLVSKRVWGNLIVIDHGIVDGKPLFSRYGHIEAMLVQPGDTVTMGQQIANIGNGEGLFAYHLHFDISTTTQLESAPSYWPGRDRQGVKHHFVDPKAWLEQHHVVNSPAGDTNTSGDGGSVERNEAPPKPAPIFATWYVIAPNGAQAYKNSRLDAEKTVLLARGSKLNLAADARNDATYTWVKVLGGAQDGQWLVLGKKDRSEVYVSTNPPQ
jgi:hypothetical protein